jgi:hypothetical protein
MPKLDPPESLLATALGTRIARTAKMTAPPTTWKSGLAGPGAQIHVKAELRLHVVVQRVASATGRRERILRDEAVSLPSPNPVSRR